MLERSLTLAVAAFFGGIGDLDCSAKEKVLPLWQMEVPSVVRLTIGQVVSGKRLEASGLAFDDAGNLFMIGQHGVAIRVSAPKLEGHRTEPLQSITPETITLVLNGDADFEAISVFEDRLYVADEGEAGNSASARILSFDLDDLSGTAPVELKLGGEQVINACGKGLEGLVVTDQWLLPNARPMDNPDGVWFYLLDELEGIAPSQYKAIIYYGYQRKAGELTLKRAKDYNLPNAIAGGGNCEWKVVQRLSELIAVPGSKFGLLAIDSTWAKPSQNVSASEYAELGSYRVVPIYKDPMTQPAQLNRRHLNDWKHANRPYSLNFEGAAICPLTGDLYACTDNGGENGKGSTLLVRFPNANSQGLPSTRPIVRKTWPAPGPQTDLYETGMSNDQLRKWPYGTALVRLSLDPRDRHYDQAQLEINGRKTGTVNRCVPLSMAGHSGVCRLRAGSHFVSFTAERDKVYTWHFRLNEFAPED